MPHPKLSLIAILILLAVSWVENSLAEGPLPTDMQSGSLLLKMQEGYVTAMLTNTDVAWPGGTVVECYPASVSDLYRGEPATIKAIVGTALALILVALLLFAIGCARRRTRHAVVA
jgi:hypothetical protein